MKKPLILLLYEKMLPGSQLINRLQDLGYEVQTLSAPDLLVGEAERSSPLLIIADLEPKNADVCNALTELRKNPATTHIPVIILVCPGNTESHEAARSAGATLVVNDNAILLHLKEFLEQALLVE